MKILRFIPPGDKKIYYGIIKQGNIFVLKNSPYKNFSVKKDNCYNINSVKLLAPCEPSKIILVGLNYRDHARELGMRIPKTPILFLKPPTSITNPFENIVYPKNIKRLDYEAELAIVIKNKCRYVKKHDVKHYMLGYTCLNDVTARDIQKNDIQWTRAKSFDTFCPIGPWIETDLNTSNLKILSYLNNNLVQSSSTKYLIFKPETLVSFISGIMTLMPGDIIATGTPPGVGPMKRKDIVRVEIEGVGALTNTVI